MPAIQSTDIADLVAGTLRELGRLKIQQIAQELSRYEVFPIWFKKNKVTFDAGIGIQRNLMTRAADTAAHRGMTDADVVTIQDHIKQIQVPWRILSQSYAFIKQEILQNRGTERIFDLIQVRRSAAMLDMVQVLEEKAWASPSSSSDTVLPYGVPYWVVKNATTGHTGLAASGHSTVGGLDPTTNTTWRNYAGLYTTVNKADLVKKMRNMHFYTGFQSPVDVKDYTSGKGMQYRVYCNRSTTADLEDIGEAQNENLGRDIASIDGFSLTFRRNPIRTIQILDADTSNPVYFLDHSTFYPVCLKGDYFRETVRKMASNQHDITEVFIDLSYNYLCVDRRRNGVLATSAS